MNHFSMFTFKITAAFKLISLGLLVSVDKEFDTRIILLISVRGIPAIMLINASLILTLFCSRSDSFFE